MRDIRDELYRRYSPKDFREGERLRIYLEYSTDPFVYLREGVILTCNKKRGLLEALQLKLNKKGATPNLGPWEDFLLKNILYRQTYIISNIHLVEELDKTRWIIRYPKIK